MRVQNSPALRTLTNVCIWVPLHERGARLDLSNLWTPLFIGNGRMYAWMASTSMGPRCSLHILSSCSEEGGGVAWPLFYSLTFIDSYPLLFWTEVIVWLWAVFPCPLLVVQSGKPMKNRGSVYWSLRTLVGPFRVTHRLKLPVFYRLGRGHSIYRPTIFSFRHMQLWQTST